MTDLILLFFDLISSVIHGRVVLGYVIKVTERYIFDYYLILKKMIGLFKKKVAGYENVSVEEFSKLRLDINPIVLDVRAPEELAEGFIPNYRQINFFNTSFREELERLDRSKTYLVYCRSGNRSGKACQMMSKMGFENLYNLRGGIQAWNALTQR
ncbi:MAG: hypothetical protein Roseis2KO_22850 [Roseivirga sp.]